jgi:3-oxoadipate enol-lactonase
MPILETAELAIHYETAGRGRHAIVLVHGNFATWRWWHPILTRPPRGFRIYAPTLRGFGATHSTTRARSVDILARDLHAFAHGLGLDRFHLVGHSLGGAVALEYALTWPSTLHSLDLIAPAAGDALEAMRARTDAMGTMLRWTDPQWLASRMMLHQTLRWQRYIGAHRATLARALAGMMPSAEPAAIGFEALLADALAIDELVVIDTYEALRRWDIRARLQELAVPVRVLAGGRDALVPVGSLEALARGLPRARLDVWPDVGHSPQLERPAQFATWLEQVRPARFVLLRERVRAAMARLHRLLRRTQRSLPSGSDL